MGHLKGITIVLMIILILFITTALICEFFGCDLLCSEQKEEPKNKEEKTYKPVKNMSTKKLLAISSEGILRGFLMGGLTGGMLNAATYGVSLGILNPFMVALLYYLPSGSLFKL